MFCAMHAMAQVPSRWKMDSLQHYLQRAEGVTVINFWASFCKPCVEEMPQFIKTVSGFRSDGVNLIFVSLDLADKYPGPLKRFIRKNKIKDPVVWLDETDADYFIPLVDSSWTGTIPATLIVNNRNGFRQFYESEMDEAYLKKEILAALGR